MIVNALALLILIRVLDSGGTPAWCALALALLLGAQGLFTGLTGWDLLGHAMLGFLISCGYFYLLNALRGRSLLRVLVSVCGGALLILS